MTRNSTSLDKLIHQMMKTHDDLYNIVHTTLNSLYTHLHTVQQLLIYYQMNKYEIIGIVGEGAYGIVYKAKNKESGDFGIILLHSSI